MSDIVDRLIGLYLGIHEVSPRYAEEVCKEAADLIERQAAVIEAAREIAYTPPCTPKMLDDLRAAVRALDGGGDE